MLGLGDIVFFTNSGARRFEPVVFKGHLAETHLGKAFKLTESGVLGQKGSKMGEENVCINALFFCCLA